MEGIVSPYERKTLGFRRALLLTGANREDYGEIVLLLREKLTITFFKSSGYL